MKNQHLTGFLLALIGAILFSAKGVLAKLMYGIQGVDVVTVLVLRMLFALPFFAAIFFISLRRVQKTNGFSQPQRKAIGLAALVGILGYYVSSLLNFSGLQYISAGLERIILYSYPTFVLLFGAIFYRTPVTSFQLAAVILAYAGIVLAFSAHVFATGNCALLGGLLVLGCAITYGLYVLWSGKIIPVLGAPLFTSIAMLSATAFVFMHFWLSGHRFGHLLAYPSSVIKYGFLMAIFTTVLPSLAISAALKRIGSNQVAIVSSVGPLSSIFLAHAFLGESFGWQQGLGTVLVLAGVLIIGLKLRQTTAAA